MSDERAAKFEQRRARLREMDDEQLKALFWQLCDEVIDPIVDLARTHTSPSIERSVLLRMGIDSQSASAVVERISQAGLLGMGAGHALLQIAQERGTDVRQAADAVLADSGVLAGLAQERPR